MHRSQGVLKPAVLRRGVDPAGALELVDPPQALDPGGVDEVLFRQFLRVVRGRDGEPGVLVDRVGDQRLSPVNGGVFDLPSFHGYFFLPVTAMMPNEEGQVMGFRTAFPPRLFAISFASFSASAV